MYAKHADKDRCVCSDPHYIVGERKTLSHVVALSLLIGFFIFVSGYFLGKRVATQEFLHQFEQESFADRISHSLHTQYSSHAAALDTVKQAEAETVGAQSSQSTSMDLATASPEKLEVAEAQQTVVQPTAVPTLVLSTESKLAESAPTTKKSDKSVYFAQLFGGTREAAQRCVDLLAHRGITTRMVKKSSKTARSNVVYWYQVETDTFSDRTALEDLVSTVKKIAKLHDVKIVKG
jgi:hypothetical protein